MSGDITVILNGYKRPQFLKEQVEAVKNQTVPPKEVMLWLNNIEGFDKNLTDGLLTASCNRNLGVWARFIFALNAKTEYICIFDDDTIPGNMWFENCLNTMKTHEGLLGGKGLIFMNKDEYLTPYGSGWNMKNNRVEQVDIVGHSWFFKREWLTYYFRELPPVEFDLVGEDMWFSYMLQKYANINTYVPPHPAHLPQMWSSLKGWEMGIEGSAISLIPSNITKMGDFYRMLTSKGFKIINNG